METAGRTAIVTGGAAGTGKAIAERLGAEGANVIVADVDTELATALVQQIELQGGRAQFVRADVRQGSDIEHIVSTTDRLFGRLDILVNNAGGGGHIEPHFPEATPLQWGSTIDLNLRGAMLATQLVLEPMHTQGEGVVVNIASTAGLGFTPYHSPEYAAAKAGLIRFTSALAHLKERVGVRVNCVVPDWIATDRALSDLQEMTAEERAKAPTPIPVDDVAEAVSQFVRDDRLAGRVMVLRGGETPLLLDPDRRD